MMRSQEKQIIKAVDNLQEDILEMIQCLVREPSTLGNEASVLAVMEGFLNKLGLKSKKNTH